jgi:hypothetical protein
MHPTATIEARHRATPPGKLGASRLREEKIQANLQNAWDAGHDAVMLQKVDRYPFDNIVQAHENLGSRWRNGLPVLTISREAWAQNRTTLILHPRSVPP